MRDEAVHALVQHTMPALGRVPQQQFAATAEVKPKGKAAAA